MLVHSCLFVLLCLMSHIVYICKIIFEQINDDDDELLNFMHIMHLNLGGSVVWSLWRAGLISGT